MKRPLSNDLRTRIIRELVEQAPEPTEQWYAAGDEELVKALNDNRERKLSALASTIESETKHERRM